MSEAQFFKEHDPAELAEVLLVESDVDFTIHHSLPIVDFLRDGMAATAKGHRLRELAPERVILYESIKPLPDGALEEVEAAATALDADGIKLYPARHLKRHGDARPRPEVGPRVDGRRVCPHAGRA